MRKLPLVAALLALSLSTYSQKAKDKPAELPGFGKVDKADLQMKSCDFDEKAEAFVLIDEGELSYAFGNMGPELRRRVRIKILSEKGLEKANIHLDYNSEKNGSEISGIEAQTYNLDASGNMVATKLEKKLIYDKKLSKRTSEKAFTFPEVKVGSIIEYKYKKTNIGLIDWYLQYDVPVRVSRFITDFPEEIEVATIPYCNSPYSRNEKSSGTRMIKTYSVENVVGFRDEPYIINEDFYRDRLETKLIAITANNMREPLATTWIRVIRQLMDDEDFGLQLKKNIPRTAELDAQLKNINAPFERMKTIFNYVKSNMQWNDYYGIWAIDGVKSAWKDKKGTVGEINLILVNLLKDAGLNAHAVLVSSHDYGIVNTLDPGTLGWPGYHQFNKVMAYITIGEEVYVLDASQKDNPVHLIPKDVVETQGLVIEKAETFEWGWKVLSNPKNLQKNLVLVNGQIAADGKMSGEATITSYDYDRLARLPIARKGKDKYIEKYGNSENQSVTIEDVTFANLDSDSLPLVQTIKFNQTLASSGDYKYFTANILSGLEKNPFVADTRASDVFFGANQSYTIMGNFFPPEGYEFDALPKNLKMIMPDTSIVVSRISQLSGTMLMTKIQLEFKQPIYAASQYEQFQQFYLRLFEILNEQFVIRKKK